MAKNKKNTKVKGTAPEKSVPSAPGGEQASKDVMKSLQQVAAILLIMHAVDTLSEIPKEAFASVLDLPDNTQDHLPVPETLESVKIMTRILLDARGKLIEHGKSRSAFRAANNAM